MGASGVPEILFMRIQWGPEDFSSSSPPLNTFSTLSAFVSKKVCADHGGRRAYERPMTAIFGDNIEVDEAILYAAWIEWKFK